MFVVLPITAWILLFLIFYKNSSWRNATLSGAVVWGIILTAITEILSFFKFINFGSILLAWLLTIASLVLIYFKKKPIKNNKSDSDTSHQLSLDLIMLLVGITMTTSIVGLIALIAAPNNVDSLAYHLPRIVHWIQNRTVAHYPTNYLPQLYQSPWSEFTIMHFQLLSGHDRFSNLVQWFSMIGSMIGVSLLAKQLGSDLRGQVLSTVVSATIPMGILQASNTKNDYVVSFWMVCLAYYVLLTVKEKGGWSNFFGVGASLGLAIFSKGTAYIYALPFLVYFLGCQVKVYRWKIWKSISVILITVLTINISHWLRNIDLFGYPVATGNQKYTNEVFTLPTFLSNIIRNIGLHISLQSNFIDDNILQTIIYSLHQFLGVDINDTRTTWPGTTFGIYSLPTFEDTASNPIHFYLILLVICLCVICPSLRKQKTILYYLLCVSGGFLLFCFLLKWQPWHSRLHLPIFILFCPLMGAVISNVLSRKMGNCIAFFLIGISLIWVFYNKTRPIIAEENIFNTSRVEQYFNMGKSLKYPYTEAVNFVKFKKCSNLGLNLDVNVPEYPFWILLQEDKKLGTRIKHINVQNVSSAKSGQIVEEKFIPCAIIAVESTPTKELITEFGTYFSDWSVGSKKLSFSVLIKR